MHPIEQRVLVDSIGKFDTIYFLGPSVCCEKPLLMCHKATVVDSIDEFDTTGMRFHYPKERGQKLSMITNQYWIGTKGMRGMKVSKQKKILSRTSKTLTCGADLG